MLKKNRKKSGLLLTIFFAIVTFYIFYGNLLSSLNSKFFATQGDGLKSYYTSQYHVDYDKGYLYSHAMNYPYGEIVFFADCQPVITNTIKFISNNIFNISDYTIGIINFLMLFSIILTPIFLYLFFRQINMPGIISIPASIAIGFLSPQLNRFGGHFTLSYVCAIPLILYLLTLFYKKHQFKYSIIISLIVFIGALTHFYYYGFFGLLILFYWVCHIIKNYKKEKIWHSLIHLFIQLILPFLIIQFIYLSDNVTDRTANPWGILYYRAFPESVFLPLGKPYGKFLYKLSNFKYINWEGIAYVGLIGTIGFLLFIGHFIKNVFSKNIKNIFNVTNNRILNIFLWASFIALLYSFGIPFIFGLEFLLDYVGPLKQMRGIARFSWLFFYMINIVTIYWLWNWYKTAKKKVFAGMLIALCMLFMFYDAWLNVKGKGNWLNNRIEVLDDTNNNLPENQWINNINPEDYQAIIPIPYFHIGSENIWIDNQCDIAKSVFITSLKTGLPTTGVMLSRTSLGQTYRSYSLMLEPYRMPGIFRDFKNTKPFLIMAGNCEMLTESELNLIEHAQRVDSLKAYNIYNISSDSLKVLFDSLYYKKLNEYNYSNLFNVKGFQTTDTIENFFYNGFESTKSKNAYYGPGCYSSQMRSFNTIFFDRIPNYDTTQTYIVSFWFGNLKTDLYPRTVIEIAFYDSNEVLYKTDYKQVFKLLKIIDNNWALVEYKFKLNDPADKIKITLWNKSLRNNEIIIDELLLKPENNDIYYKDNNYIWKNDRIYYRTI